MDGLQKSNFVVASLAQQSRHACGGGTRGSPAGCAPGDGANLQTFLHPDGEVHLVGTGPHV